MLGISHSEGGSHSKRINFVCHAFQHTLKGGQVKWHWRMPVVVMSASNNLYRNARECLGNPRFFHHGRIKANQYHTHRTAVAFNHGIGGQRRGH